MNSLDRFVKESAEDFTVASKSAMESSSFLLVVKLTFIHLRRLGLLWFQTSLVLTMALVLSKNAKD